MIDSFSLDLEAQRVMSMVDRELFSGAALNGSAVKEMPGWARFSDDLTMRYRLGRACSDAGRAALLDCWTFDRRYTALSVADLVRITFLMLNPSTADAFKPDPTVSECIRFARLWRPDVDIVEVVNLFAFRSPYPAVLRQATDRGSDALNDEQILEACSGAAMVVAAWGTGGALEERDEAVSGMLERAGVPGFRLGLTKELHPKHPLARGKHRIPREQQPIPHPWVIPPIILP